MESKGPSMLELAVSSEGKHFMAMMLLSRSPQERHATVGQNGAACVVGLEKRMGRARWGKRRGGRRNNGRHQCRSMRLKTLKCQEVSCIYPSNVSRWNRIMFIPSIISCCFCYISLCHPTIMQDY